MSGAQSRPTYIPIPPPLFGTLTLTPSSSSPDDPFDSFSFDTASSTPFDERLHSGPPTPFGELQFHTAPSSPLSEDPVSLGIQHPIPLQFSPIELPTPVERPPSPSPFNSASSTATPPLPSLSTFPPLSASLPTLSLHSPFSTPAGPVTRELPPEDTFPTLTQPFDTTLDDEALSTLEKIYLFSRSKTTSHRIFITRALPLSLDQVTSQEAVEYVLPLLGSLAMDEDESVKEALAAELVPVMWWFFTHCQLTTDDLSNQDITTLNPTPISVQAFTPILATLLLSPNFLVGGGARHAVVDFLRRIRRADERDHISANVSRNGAETDELAKERDELDKRVGVGFFGPGERRLFEQELLQQVVIGIGRLDDDEFDGVFSEEDGELAQEDFSAMVIDTDTSSAATVPTPISMHGSAEAMDVEVGDETEISGINSPIPVDEEGYAKQEQAAAGRLSSMSLMAAVTASGLLNEDVEPSFVNEVERVGTDEVYLVRREATFTLGALAKVVPNEVVLCSLLPLFENLRIDPVWHVRYSALFALPAILSRLSPRRRRELALDTLIPLSKDESAEVRLGVLEVLGEVMYTFLHDECGPPEELLRLFLGKREDRRLRDVQQGVEGHEKSLGSNFERIETSPTAPLLSPSAVEVFYDEPSRALVCAFNYPAVSLTLGRTQWDTLREAYLDLAARREVRVRQTLAASLGELARIVGPDHARRDLMGVWFDSVRCEEEAVRMRAVECVNVFVEALLGADPAGVEASGMIVKGLLKAWEEDVLNGWREREGAAKAILGLARLVGWQFPELIRGLLKRALEDGVASVREVGTSSVSPIWELFADRPDVLDDLRNDILGLADPGSYRRRMTFVACQHALVVPGDDGQPVWVADDGFWKAIIPLAYDQVVGVRIGVARLVGEVCDMRIRRGQTIGGVLLEMVGHLSLDSSHEVRSYIQLPRPRNPVCKTFKKPHSNSSIISRPPLHTAAGI